MDGDPVGAAVGNLLTAFYLIALLDHHLGDGTKGLDEREPDLLGIGADRLDRLVGCEFLVRAGVDSAFTKRLVT